MAVSPGDILTRAARPPDHVLRYGPGPEQVADLRLPPAERIAEKGEPTVLNSGKESETCGGADSDAGPGAPGPDSGGLDGMEVEGRPGAGCPLVIFLHGGFWRSAYDRTHVGPLSEALAAAGFAVCAPEYRRTGQPGGGWPGTFDDVAAAVDALPEIAAQASGGVADASRVVLAGHSAGGHLALWAASRDRLSASAPWRARPPSRPAVAGVVSLAGVCDLAACYRLGLDGDAAGDLMGGGPERFPDRYRAADPMSLVPAAAPAWLVHGTVDNRVPDSQSREYTDRAAAAGGQVHVEVLPGCGHFELIDPLSAVWPAVLGAFRAAAGGQAIPGLAG
ncbi:MAG TPA: alpha/beta hydrolase [Streptosporangiaceae bacterium]|nr:alpha/beta hydrolase [Streptosporangiaceae bacterium]